MAFFWGAKMLLLMVQKSRKKASWYNMVKYPHDFVQILELLSLPPVQDFFYQPYWMIFQVSGCWCACLVTTYNATPTCTLWFPFWCFKTMVRMPSPHKSTEQDNMRLRKDLRTLAEEFGKASAVTDWETTRLMVVQMWSVGWLMDGHVEPKEVNIWRWRSGPWTNDSKAVSDFVGNSLESKSGTIEFREILNHLVDAGHGIRTHVNHVQEMVSYIK